MIVGSTGPSYTQMIEIFHPADKHLAYSPVSSIKIGTPVCGQAPEI